MAPLNPFLQENNARTYQFIAINASKIFSHHGLRQTTLCMSTGQ